MVKKLIIKSDQVLVDKLDTKTGLITSTVITKGANSNLINSTVITKEVNNNGKN